jgi:hypothetical protein
MLFRNSSGLLIEINKNSYKNDQLYYTKISEIKGLNITTNTNTKISLETIENKYSTQAIGKLLSSF